MKKVLVLLFIFYSIGYAQTYINIKNKDGTTQSFNLNEITKITFSNLVNVNKANRLLNSIKEFVLLHNYPNPFNPSTTIKYQIPKSGNVEVMIFNTKGELVKTLLNKYQEAGTHLIKWEGINNKNQNVASGVYISTVKFNNHFLSQKMILVK